jgi:arylformamidase
MAVPRRPDNKSGATLYRGFTRVALDRAYSPSAMVPSIDPFLRRYAEQSAAVRAVFDPARWSTERYGATLPQSLDLFRPETLPAPLLVFFHGGYWQALSKDDASFPAQTLAAEGCAYATVNYTLAPEAGMDAIVEECRAALAFLWSARERFDLDARGIVIAGHSAGAHLAAMMLTTAWAERAIDPAFIKGALLLGGVYDLEPIRQSYVNDALGLDEVTARRNSPLFDVPRVACPVVVTWAERDTHEFKRQSCELASRWAQHGSALASFEQTNVNHFDSLFDLCNPITRLAQETLRLLQ